MINKDVSYKIRILSGISILMVVYIHSFNIGLFTSGIHIDRNSFIKTFWIEKFFSDGICRTAVPLFFLFSGWLFFQNYKTFEFHFFISKWKRRFRSIAMPFLIWSAMGILFYFVLQQLPWSAPYFNSIPIKELSFKDITFIWLILPVNFQLWFLQVLIITILFTPFIGLFAKRAPILFNILLCIIWFITGGYNGFINYLVEGIFFFSLGSTLAIKKKTPIIKTNSVFLFLFLWILLILSKLILEDINYPVSIITGKISIFAGLLFLWNSTDKIKHQRLLKFSSYSFWLFLFHEPINTILKKALLSSGSPLHHYPLIVYIIAPVIVASISIVTALIVKRFIPGIYNILVGGRE